jgi:hypothetical protein
MTNDAGPTVTGPIQTIEKSPTARAFTGLGLAIVGGLLLNGGVLAAMVTGIVDDIAGNNISIVVFFVGVAFLLIAIVLAIIGLVRRGAKLVPIITLVLALLPPAFLLLLRLLAV